MIQNTKILFLGILTSKSYVTLAQNQLAIEDYASEQEMREGPADIIRSDSETPNQVHPHHSDLLNSPPAPPLQPTPFDGSISQDFIYDDRKCPDDDEKCL